MTLPHAPLRAEGPASTTSPRSALALAYVTCPFPGCPTQIPLDGRAGCHYHVGDARPVNAPSLLIRPCMCGGTIDATSATVAAAVRRHVGTSQHMRWALGLMPFSGRRQSDAQRGQERP